MGCSPFGGKLTLLPGPAAIDGLGAFRLACLLSVILEEGQGGFAPIVIPDPRPVKAPWTSRLGPPDNITSGWRGGLICSNPVASP